MNIFRKADRSTVLIPLTWRQRLAAHVFDEAIILMLVLPIFRVLDSLRAPGSGAAWIFLIFWLGFRALCHVFWPVFSWPKSHATPGLWMFRAKVKTLDGATPSRHHRRFLERPAIPFLLRAVFFIGLSLALNLAIPDSEWGALVWIWCWGELCVMLSTLLAPWKKGFSNIAPTAQDLATHSRPFIDRPHTLLGLASRAVALAIVAYPFCFFIFVVGEAALKALFLDEPNIDMSWTSCGIIKKALKPILDC